MGELTTISSSSSSSSDTTISSDDAPLIFLHLLFASYASPSSPSSSTSSDAASTPSPTPPTLTIRKRNRNNPNSTLRSERTKRRNLKDVEILSDNISTAVILPQSFFEVDAVQLARRLLGKLLRKDNVVLEITEVEAYMPNDTACHGRFGTTSRTAPVFGPGGHAYVNLCYGLNMMLNIVADKEGVGAAVLVRSCAPISGLETIQERRGQKSETPALLNGPGKVGQALGLSTDWSHHPLYTPGGLEVLDGPEPEKILVGPRVGIEYALPEHVTAPWRFAIAGSPWISPPKKTLGPS